MINKLYVPAMNAMNAGDGPQSYVQNSSYQGRFSEAEVDSFNIPLYFAAPNELKAILEKSRSFSMERLETLGNAGKYSWPDANARAAFHRAALERSVARHFGSGIMDELVDLYMNKVGASPVFCNPENDKTIIILAVLKRTSHNQ